MGTTGSSAFLSGGGVMGAQLRSFDWPSTPLGPLSHWSVFLRVAVEQVMATQLPMCLVWGTSKTLIVNDAYEQTFSTEPTALGRSFDEVWGLDWPQLREAVAAAERAESSVIERLQVPLTDTTSFNVHVVPVFDAGAKVSGSFCTWLDLSAERRSERRALEERERHKNLLRRMPGFAAVLVGPDHVIEYANDASVRFAGGRPLLGRAIRAVFPDLAGQGLFELLDRVYRSGTPYEANAIPVDLSLEGHSGQRFLDLLFEPMRDSDGTVYGVFVGGYDVTVRVQAEEEWRQSEARLRALNAELEQRVIERTMAVGRTWQVSPDLLCVIGADGRFEATNPAWMKTLGWTDAEMNLAGFKALVHPDDIGPTIAAWVDANERKLPVLQLENRYRTKSGEWRWLSWLAVHDDGKVYCVTRDITAQKVHAEALASRTAERDILAAIVKNTDAIIQALDTDFRVLAINQAAIDEYSRLYGRHPSVGDNVLDLFADVQADGELAKSLWSRALAGESFTVQSEFGRAEGKASTYEIQFEALRDAAGQQVGAYHISQDITERLREQRALLDAQEALRHAQKMEAVGQLTGGIAHDFNNLLGAISSSLQVARRHTQQGDQGSIERYLEMAERSLQSAAGMTQRLLAFSRRQTLDPRPVDVRRLVQGMAELIGRTVGPGIQLMVRDAPMLWPSRVDPSQLESAVLNLCINARDAMPNGGRLSVDLTNVELSGESAQALELPEGGYVRLCVTDTGSGMPPEVRDRVFDPFFTTKPLGQGTGLGLSMVYGFVRQSGGQIDIETELGKGTQMCLYLPRHFGDVQPEISEPVHDEARGGDGQVIVLIEDEETIREVLSGVLADADYQVHEARDGPAGLAQLQRLPKVDLLVTDVGLPGGLNGRQVADAARRRHPSLKVLFITGYVEDAQLGSALTADGMAVLTKPFEISTLTRKVRRMLDAST